MDYSEEHKNQIRFCWRSAASGQVQQANRKKVMRIYIQIGGLFQSKLEILEIGDTLKITWIELNFRYPDYPNFSNRPVFACMLEIFRTTNF